MFSLGKSTFPKNHSWLIIIVLVSLCVGLQLNEPEINQGKKDPQEQHGKSMLVPLATSKSMNDTRI